MATTVTSLPARGSSSRRALFVALAFGAVSALLVLAFLNHASSGSSAAPTTPIMVAAQDIPLGAEITDQNITLKPFPTIAKHPNAFTDKTKASALHQVALEPIAAGQEILSSQLTKNQAEVGLTALIPPGHRAIAIAVSEVTAGGGFIRPGDSVDVIGQFQVNSTAPSSAVLAMPKGQDQNKVYVAVTVLQNVKVLAIGQSAQQPSQNTGPTSTNNLKPSTDQVQAKSVTLSLTPDEAQKIFLAEQIGSLRLAGRPLGDTDSVQVGPQDNGLQGLLAPAGR
jgi:pilus assembly protein CpaB